MKHINRPNLIAIWDTLAYYLSLGCLKSPITNLQFHHIWKTSTFHSQVLLLYKDEPYHGIFINETQCLQCRSELQVSTFCGCVWSAKAMRDNVSPQERYRFSIWGSRIKGVSLQKISILTFLCSTVHEKIMIMLLHIRVFVLCNTASYVFSSYKIGQLILFCFSFGKFVKDFLCYQS